MEPVSLFHQAPVGGKYDSIEDAGSSILANFCENFPNTSESFLIPPIVKSTYPEGKDPMFGGITRPFRKLTAKENDRWNGINANQRGDDTEHEISYNFGDLFREKQDHPTLVLQNFKVVVYKRKAIMKDYPKMQSCNKSALESDSKEQEHDFLVLVKDLGCVIIEVKSNINAVSKAEDQATRLHALLNILFNAVAPSQSNALPVAKIVAIPNHKAKSIGVKYNDNHHFYRDSLDKFTVRWQDVIEELRKMNGLTSSEFERLTWLVTGLWAMKSSNRSFNLRINNFNADDVSLGHSLQIDDEKLKKAILTSAKKEGDHVNNIFLNSPDSGMRNANEICLTYLTPMQKHIFDVVNHAIIRGHGGTGKTLLILHKIIEIIQSKNEYKDILLVAPEPHNIRCKNRLEADQVSVSEIKCFPPEPSTTGVIIMTMSDFTRVTKETFVGYDLTNYHVFLDDAHAHRGMGGNVVYDDMREKFCKLVQQNPEETLYRWMAVDVMQRDGVHGSVNEGTLRLIDAQDILTQKIFTLEHILRNTLRITGAMMEYKEKAIVKHNLPSKKLLNYYYGHNIPGASVVYHKLVDETGRHRDLFVVTRISEELIKIFRPSMGSGKPFQLNQVAILYGSSNAYDLGLTIKGYLSRKFDIISETVKEQLTSLNPTLVVDDVSNVNSAEFTVVIFVNKFSILNINQYMVSSRARTLLVIIDISEDEEPAITESVNVVRWKHEDGDFCRLKLE